MLLDDQTVMNLRLRTLLQGLPFGKRSAVVLVDMCGWTRNDAAKMMGVPRGTLDSWLFHARKNLRQALEGEDD
jgi:RNA polymerase sigma-70 factor (ECF subfamily)